MATNQLEKIEQELFTQYKSYYQHIIDSDVYKKSDSLKQFLQSYQDQIPRMFASKPTFPFLPMRFVNEEIGCLKIRVRNPLYYRYLDFPALYDSLFPTYNAQDMGGIIAMEGPTQGKDESLIRMFKNICSQDITKIIAIGRPIECGRGKFYSYFGVNENGQSVKIDITAENTRLIISSDPITATENTVSYQLQATLLENGKQPTNFKLALLQLPNSSDMQALTLTVEEQYLVYQFIEGEAKAAEKPRVAVHCSAGIGRTSCIIVPILCVWQNILIFANEENFFPGNAGNRFITLFTNLRYQRPGLCQQPTQFQQIILFSIVFTAFRYGVSLDKIKQFAAIVKSSQNHLASAESNLSIN